MTAEKAALFNGTVRGVVNRALRQLASLTGAELPKSGEARNLMFSAVKAVYRNFSDYEFNRRTNGHVNLADGGKRVVFTAEPATQAAQVAPLDDPSAWMVSRRQP